MKFTNAEIEKAQRLKRMGLEWWPAVGHYVWDEADLIKCESPFHDMVFFILDLKHFFRRADSVEQLQRDLCWLPTWYDARQILAKMGVTDETIATRLKESQAIENNLERLCLYELIEESLLLSGKVNLDSSSADGAIRQKERLVGHASSES